MTITEVKFRMHLESFFLTFVPQIMGIFFIKNIAFQVTMARLYNWDVKRRKDQKAVAAN